MNLRRSIAAVLAGLLVALGSYVLADQRVRGSETVAVVVASQDLPARALLTDGSLRLVTMPRSVVPNGALTEVLDASGRVLRDPLYAGGIVREQHLAAQGVELSASLLIPPGKPYAFNLPTSMFLSAPPRLQVHDRVDIVGYPKGQGIEKGGVLVADLEVIDIAPRFADNVSESAFLTVGATADEILRILAARDGYSLGLALRPYVRSGGAP